MESKVKKKKSKKSKKRDKTEAVEQQEENIGPLDQEIKELEEKLQEIQASRTGEHERINVNTKKAAAQHLQLVVSQSKLDKLEEEFLMQKEIMLEEAEVESADALFEIDVLEQQIKQLEVASSHFYDLQERSKIMNAKMNKLMEAMSTMEQEHALEVHSIKAEMLDFRRMLEHNFRKMLMDKDIEFQRKAFQGLAGDKKGALLANAKLKEEMTLQSIGLENLGQRAAAQVAELEEVETTAHQLARQSQDHHKEAAQLRKKMKANEKLIKDMEATIKMISAEEQQLATMIQQNAEPLPDLQEAHSQTAVVKEKIRQIEADIELWRARELEFSSQIENGQVVQLKDACSGQKEALELAASILRSWYQDDKRSSELRSCEWFLPFEPLLSVGTNKVKKYPDDLNELIKSSSAGTLQKSHNPNRSNKKEAMHRHKSDKVQTHGLGSLLASLQRNSSTTLVCMEGALTKGSNPSQRLLGQFSGSKGVPESSSYRTSDVSPSVSKQYNQA